MVERRDQLDVLGEQHPVAEHVAGHVADADDREVLALGVDAHLAEVPLDRLPGAAGRDAHRLVVVAHRPARRERVTEPEAVVSSDAVGDVGERRRALVGCHDEVGVVAVVADHVGRRLHLAAHQVVGDVEQAADETAVARDALGHQRLTVGSRVTGRCGRPLEDEAALRADRDDDGVLDHLRLHQAEHLGAEVLAAVGPPQPTAGDSAEAQVHALEARAVDPDLVLRPRAWQVGNPLRVHLEREERLGLAVGIGLEVVGAQRRLDHAEQRSQDAVLVETLDRVEGSGDLLAQAVGDVGRVLDVLGVEARLEQPHQQPGDLAVGAQALLDVGLAERRPTLAQVLRVGPQHHRLPPGEAGAQHQRVEAVALGRARPHRGERVLEQRRGSRPWASHPTAS